MKNTIILSVFAAVLTMSITPSLSGQTITTPRTPSPAAEVSQTIGISKVTVNYSRPSVNGRNIWGELVPYGWNVIPFGSPYPAPWRAGANENTTLEISHAAMIGGKKVPAGKYGLFFTINADDSGEVILSKDNRAWGNFFYNPAHDLQRSAITIRDHEMTERLTYDFINLTKNSAELVLNWENKQFPVPIEFAVDDIVMANAADELSGAMGFTWQGYTSGANYAMQNKINPELGLQWANRAVAINKSFTTLNVKTALLRQLGQNEEAEKTQAEALTLATEVELNAYGYQLLNQGKMDEAIATFKSNTERHPESANAWDSLGEGYALKGGEDKEAIKAFKKSLSLNPPAATRANSEMYLKKLGEN